MIINRDKYHDNGKNAAFNDHLVGVERYDLISGNVALRLFISKELFQPFVQILLKNSATSHLGNDKLNYKTL